MNSPRFRTELRVIFSCLLSAGATDNVLRWWWCQAVSVAVVAPIDAIPMCLRVRTLSDQPTQLAIQLGVIHRRSVVNICHYRLYVSLFRTPHLPSPVPLTIARELAKAAAVGG